MEALYRRRERNPGGIVMRWWKKIRYRLRPLRNRSEVHRSIEEEMTFHLEMETRKNIEAGLSPEEARRKAVVDFGGVERFKEEVREVDGVHWIERVIGDVRYTLRMLRRNPGFTAVALLTLAIGIGASTAIFSVVDGILIRPLPFPESERLVTAWADFRGRGGPEQEWFSYPNYVDLRNESETFQSLAIYGGQTWTLTGEGEAEQIVGSAVSHGMLSDVLRVAPILGRGFRPEDDLPNAEPVVLMSYEMWSTRFGQDAEIVDRRIELNGVPTTVIGVLPQGFRQPYQPQSELWSMMGFTDTEFFGSRGSVYLRVLGRLQPDVSLEAANARAQELGDRLAAEYPQSNTGVTFWVTSMRDDLVEVARPALWVLLGAVGFVLALVSVNLANLLLARGSSRGREFSVRSALGARKSRLTGQILTEGLVLAFLGGAAGLLIATFGTELLVSLAPAGTPRIHEVAVDGRILLFTMSVSIASGLLFSLAPAWIASGTDLRAGMSTTPRAIKVAGSRISLQGALVGGQLALAMILLVGAGLMLRSFSHLNSLDLGFQSDDVVTFSFVMPNARYPDAESRLTFIDQVERRTEGIAGILAVGSTSTIPLSGNDSDFDYQIEGRPPPPPDEGTAAWLRRVTPGYFDAMRIPIVRGRAFSEADTRGTSEVVLINETFAEAQFPGEDPVGRRVNLNSFDDPVWREIVGVVSDVRNFDIRDDRRESVYFPYLQSPSGFMTLVARTTDDPLSVTSAIRREIAEVDPTVAAPPILMNDLVQRALAPDRFVTLLLTLFAGVALTLAAVGLYGVVSYGVSRRMKEIGLKIALGAGEARVGGEVVKGTLVLAGLGLTVGLIGAYFVSRMISGLLYGIDALDPATHIGMAFVLAASAVVASLVPARRASRVDPIRVLKTD